MIHSVGLDVIDIRRMQQSLQRFGTRFRHRVFTEQECRYCDSRSEAHVHFAARFAAKEAMMKALGTGWGQGVDWKQIEVLSGEGSPPRLVVSGRADELCRSLRIHLSLSHSRFIAAAVVVLEKVERSGFCLSVRSRPEPRAPASARRVPVIVAKPPSCCPVSPLRNRPLIEQRRFPEIASAPMRE